jgi:DNA ligase 1
LTPLAELVHASGRVGATSSRLAKVRELGDFLKKLEPGEIPIAIPYLSGDIRQGRLAVGFSALQSSRTTPVEPASLALSDVDSAFSRLKNVKGKGAAQQRAALLRELFRRATADEQDFLVRLMVGELRQGALEGIMVDAVASASGRPAAEVRRAVAFAGAIAPVAQAALAGKALDEFSVRLMQPVLPMLAQPAEDARAAIEALGEALVEWKLDGARVQVHKDGDEVRVYTRNLNEVTARVPEIVSSIRETKPRSLILDGEAIALRPDRRPYPFQMTMSRFGSRQDPAAGLAERPLSAFFFDCLYVDGESLFDHPTRERRAALCGSLNPERVTPAVTTSDAEEADRFYQAALAAGHEGVMVKDLKAPYEAGRRGAAWLKVKRARTLDLVVLAAEWGHGRRRGWLSNLHLGARDPDGGFVMLGKTFKGLTDAMLEWQTRELQKLALRRDEWVVHVRPELVVEIAFNDLQESSQYPGGLALRFARVKGYRPDKGPGDADTIDTVRRIHQESVA